MSRAYLFHETYNVKVSFGKSQINTQKLFPEVRRIWLSHKLRPSFNTTTILNNKTIHCTSTRKWCYTWTQKCDATAVIYDYEWGGVLSLQARIRNPHYAVTDTTLAQPVTGSQQK